MDTINGTVAIVTGASSGIGEGIATMLAAEGVKVTLVARRQRELQRVAEAIRQQGGTALIAPAAGGLGFWHEPPSFSDGRGRGGRRALPTVSRGECEDGARDSDSHDAQPLLTRFALTSRPATASSRLVFGTTTPSTRARIAAAALAPSSCIVSL
ncbi:MAG: SDR family NAD(P)-dependent oxidoreductase [Chloroflexota bacterium]|nr:SDR family NAD(P)-dependent oxidoreductase [Chloroflexota bacterium]